MAYLESPEATAESGSLSEQTTALLNSLLATHSKGLDTTIYADFGVLETINSSVRNGIIGLLQPDAGMPRARNIKALGVREPAAESGNGGGLPDGSHVLFLVGSVSWPQSVWPEIARVLTRTAYSSCTLCVSTPEEIWGDIAAVFPPSTENMLQPLNKPNVLASLQDLLGQGQQTSDGGQPIVFDDTPVAIHTAPLLAAMPLAESVFLLPDTRCIFPILSTGSKQSEDNRLGFLQGKDWRPKHNSGDVRNVNSRQQVEQLSLNIMTLLRGLNAHGNFYSLGDTARRVARRCAGISKNIDSNSPRGTLEDAVVVLVDRTADMVSPVHHGRHILDQIYRALPANSDVGEPGSDRVVEAQGSIQPGLIAGNSLLSLLRQCQPDKADVGGSQASLDLWETLLMQSKAVALQVLRSNLASELAIISNNPEEATAPVRGRVTTEQLQTMVDAYNAQPQSPDHSGALADVVQAVINMEKVGLEDHWKEIEGAEKTLKLVIGSIKDTLADTSVVGGMHSSSMDDYALDEEMSAAWDQVLAAIPPLTARMLEHITLNKPWANQDVTDGQIAEYLWQHTPAPGMILMAASLLAPAKSGIPSGQRPLVEQRLAADYSSVSNALSQKQAFTDSARQWAQRVADYADLVAASEGQRSSLTQWRELASMTPGPDGAYAGLLERIVRDVLSGCRCVDLEHAEQGAATAAANLLKGLGRRFLTGDGPSAGVSQQNAGEAAAGSRMVVVFVVGGVTYEEAARVVAVARQLGGVRSVLIGGTTTSSARDCARLSS
ncbi:Sec1 domain-containing protein 2 [Coemansia sp. RSA 2131]|nr:Sec1 domain-containing protein 2 [Coemansia sp. RSA 2131]